MISDVNTNIAIIIFRLQNWLVVLFNYTLITTIMTWTLTT